MSSKKIWIPVVVGSLGYFVDIYDLVLFSIVRVASLKSLGVPESELLSLGVTLLNWQMVGLLIGGVAWGILGDKRGRLSVLFGSIFLYSAANIANSFVQSVPMYAALRFIAGIGLAGELGAAITLVAETLPKEIRGYGTAIVAGVGLSGAVAAGLTSDWFDWRMSYLVGGGLGLCLLILRLGIFESGMFEAVKKEDVARGDLRLLFNSGGRALKYICCILVGVPIWFAVGILVTFSPEICKELGVTGPVSAGQGILYSYAGIAIGDLLSGVVSQWVRSRKKVVVVATLLELICILVILTSRGISPAQFYFLCSLLGFATGYWAVFVTIAAEQFGTNLRSTVATTVPNFVRGSVVVVTLLFRELSHHTSLVNSALIVGLFCIVIGLFGISRLQETHGRDLNFVDR